jgi:hypothetical protein
LPSAGDVEQFAYCAHNWLLARQGIEGNADASKRGMAVHKTLGILQASAESGKRDYRDALAWALRVAAAGLSIAVLGLAVKLDRGGLASQVLVVAALVLAVLSSALLTLALRSQRHYLKVQRAAGLVPGRLLSSDMADPAPLLTDPDWDVTGRPDYLLETKAGLVPVEVKTGHTPEHPHRSHALQLACYLRLVEARDGKRPEYGLLSYPGGVFRVPWDDALRADLKQTLARIKDAQAAGRADRDHEQPGRCRGCARRAACDQRLA